MFIFFIIFFFFISLYYRFFFNNLKSYFINNIFSDNNNSDIGIETYKNKEQENYYNIYIFHNKVKCSINKLFNTIDVKTSFFFNKNSNISFFFDKNFIFDKIISNWNKSCDWYFVDYKILIFMFIISFFLSFLIFVLSSLIGNSTTIYFERAKLSVYECGFQPFERIDKCQIFIFYRLAIFFIIFEAELIFLYPWALNICELSIYTIEYFYNAFFFIFILFFGFFYEIKNKALDF